MSSNRCEIPGSTTIAPPLSRNRCIHPGAGISPFHGFWLGSISHDFEGLDSEAVFTHVPIIRRAGPGVRVLGEYNGDQALAGEGLHLAAMFQPELTRDIRVQKLFLAKLS